MHGTRWALWIGIVLVPTGIFLSPTAARASQSAPPTAPPAAAAVSPQPIARRQTAQPTPPAQSTQPADPAQPAAPRVRTRVLEERRYVVSPGAGPFFQAQVVAPLTPELAKKTETVMALRSMLKMGLSASDIEAAVAALKELQDAEKALEAEAGQALDDEKKALLVAKPGSPTPPDSSERLMKALAQYREKQQQTWDSLAKSIGASKSSGLRRLLSDAAASASMVGAQNVVGYKAVDGNAFKFSFDGTVFGPGWTLKTVPGVGGSGQNLIPTVPASPATPAVPAVPATPAPPAPPGGRGTRTVIVGPSAPAAATTIIVRGNSLSLADLIDLLGQKLNAIKE